MLEGKRRRKEAKKRLTKKITLLRKYIEESEKEEEEAEDSGETDISEEANKTVKGYKKMNTSKIENEMRIAFVDRSTREILGEVKGTNTFLSYYLVTKRVHKKLIYLMKWLLDEILNFFKCAKTNGFF